MRLLIIGFHVETANNWVSCRFHLRLLIIGFHVGSTWSYLLNENKLADMAKILEHYHQYNISTLAADGHHCLPDGEVLGFDDKIFPYLLGR